MDGNGGDPLGARHQLLGQLLPGLTYISNVLDIDQPFDKSMNPVISALDQSMNPVSELIARLFRYIKISLEKTLLRIRMRVPLPF